jgi:3-polyprenyl-4-hydroxybenzoate decarboxylase
VTAITHRRNALFTAILVGLPPSECNNISRTCREMMLYQHLKYGSGHPEVLEVCCPEMGGGWNWWVIRIRKTHPSLPSQVLHSAAGIGPLNKMIIVVDEDIDPKDPDAVMWAMSFGMQPQRDVQVISGRVPGLDPSAHSLMRSTEDRAYPGGTGTSALLIDATRKGPYPPVGLPQKEYMDAALELWQEEGMPALELRAPWYGYVPPNNLWTEKEARQAQRAVEGDLLDAPEPAPAPAG